MQKRYTEISVKTADNLRSVAQSQALRDISPLSLPEIDAVVDLVAQVVPAGNVPALILRGLARLPGRRPPPDRVKRDINLLFKGVKQTLNETMSAAFFAGPAMVIWGYQNLLRLAGKDPEDFFPEGTWQFYVDYALREDTARHANETYGFDAVLNQHRIQLQAVDRVTAWLMAAIHCLHQYPQLLENEWRERVHIYHLRQITQHEPNAARYARLYRDWEMQRPYERGTDVEANETYTHYRRRKFDHFLAKAIGDLPDDLRHKWIKQIGLDETGELAAYQQQMSILAYLEPGDYGETRIPIPLKQLRVGLIYQGYYYLIPACTPGAGRPAPMDVATVRALVATLMASPSNTSTVPLTVLAQIKRTALFDLRQKLSGELIRELNRLRLAPILLNCDQRPRQVPLAELRQTERGVGDHALTIFDSGETFVFDQSHIFFDGAWGAALAEIMTNEALAWAVYLSSLPPAQPGSTGPHALTFHFKKSELDWLQQVPRVTLETSAETEAINLKPILALRKLFKQRNEVIELTVNDLLILYRAIHAMSYRPKADLQAKLKELAQAAPTRQAALTALEAIDTSKQANPLIVIPVDASQRSPRDRLQPMIFEVPLEELDLLNLHRRVMAALNNYKSGQGDRTALYREFDQLQRTYLRVLAGFGQVMSRTKQIAFVGESDSIATLKMMAHLPAPLQRLLNQIPERFDMLNDIIKGREVFSNVGAVVPTSTLSRFITAKDDNEKKTLAWSVITDAKGVMRIALRDFRPHVGLLIKAGHKDLATHLTQDYLDAYANGLNNFIHDLRRIAETNRETQLAK